MRFHPLGRSRKVGRIRQTKRAAQPLPARWLEELERRTLMSMTVVDLTTLSGGAEALAQSLVGSGVTISNVKYTGSNQGAGSFSGGNGEGFGINTGVILSSGKVINAPGPNISDGTSSSLGADGDPSLDTLIAPTKTHDASVLEFDFVPTRSSLSFSYVFASEEYNEFVNSFNDAFGFFLDGANIATLPGTNTPVTINNVNKNVNSKYFHDNDISDFGASTPYFTTFDGFTTVLAAVATVTPNVTHHIKLAVADAADFALDSAVFLEAGAFTSASADITVKMSDSPEPVNPNGTITYTMTVTNNGPDPASGVKLINPLPANTTYINAFSTVGGIDNSQGTLTADIGSLASGASAIVTLLLAAPSSGIVVNAANVSSNAFDGDLSNNAATETTTVDTADVPRLTASNVAVSEGNDGTTDLTFTLSFNKSSIHDATVFVTTSDGTATLADNDYQPIVGLQVTIAAGQTSQTVTVKINGDTKTESDESITLNLSSPVWTILKQSTVTGTILNDDQAPKAGFDQITQAIPEGDSGTTLVTYNLLLSNTSDKPITLTVNTADGSATVLDTDYQPVTNQVFSFLPGQVSQSVTVLINGDRKYELDQDFSLVISNVSNGNVDPANATATTTILNDDPIPTVTFSAPNVNVPEDNSGTTLVPLSVQLSNPSDFPVSVTIDTTDDSAKVLDGDYQAAVSKLVQVSPGLISASAGLLVNGDNRFETDQKFSVIMNDPTNATMGDNHADVMIVNDDSRPTITIGDTSVVEGNAGKTYLQFPVTLSNPSDETVGLVVSTADGTATALSRDYAPITTATFTIAPLATTSTVNVTVFSDRWFEPFETMFLNLSDTSNGFPGSVSAKGTIENDDTAGFAVGSANGAPDPVIKGNPLTLTAAVQLVPGHPVKRVEFYRDVNGNGKIDSPADTLVGADTLPAGGWTVTVPTAKLPAGSVQFIVRAQDTQGNWTDFTSLFATINLPPTVGSVSVTPASSTLGQENLQISALNPVDPDGTVSAVEFWVDVDGNGIISSTKDRIISTDRDGSDGWTATLNTTGLKTGPVKILARAQDSQGAFGAFKAGNSVTLVAPPKILSLTTDLPKPAKTVPPTVVNVAQNVSFKLTATGVSASAGRAINSVYFYIDTDGNGTLDRTIDSYIGLDMSATGGWSFTTNSSFYTPGLKTFFALATDNFGAQSNTVATTINVLTGPVQPALLSVNQLAKMKNDQASLIALSDIATV